MAFPSPHSINYELANRLFDPKLFEKSFFGDDIGAIEGFNNAMLNCKNKSFNETIDLEWGGRCPGYSAVIKKYSSVVTNMEKALLGQKIEEADFATLNKEQSEFHWVFTTKHW